MTVETDSTKCIHGNHEVILNSRELGEGAFTGVLGKVLHLGIKVLGTKSKKKQQMLHKIV